MSLPKVVIDSAIWLTPSLSALPIELVSIRGTQIVPAVLEDANALLTRTVTRVDANLLQDSQITFVGTASAGTDHVDTRYLSERGIKFANAAGCNAGAVADYVLDAIYQCQRLESLISGATVGLVGYGAVGRGLAARLSKLGGKVKVYDPYVESTEAGVTLCALPEVLGCSIVSLHAALHNDQPHPSAQMIDNTAVGYISPDALFINAGRGALVTEEALHRMADKGVTLVLDTWPEEPSVSQDLLSRAALATPHIAGYTRTAKSNATDFLIEPLVRALRLDSPFNTLESEDTKQVMVDLSRQSDSDGLMDAMKAVSRLALDDVDFREEWEKSQTPDIFETQRTQYRLRDQYSALTLRAVNASTELQRLLSAAGFGLAS
ncbi:MAG: NAD(P)-dependent oxidoreductase [Pseudomonadota bacterium]|nr:NAD(P)-dependent oxidoreductase [Pseudomonadota bacterium]